MTGSSHSGAIRNALALITACQAEPRSEAMVTDLVRTCLTDPDVPVDLTVAALAQLAATLIKRSAAVTGVPGDRDLQLFARDFERYLLADPDLGA